MRLAEPDEVERMRMPPRVWDGIVAACPTLEVTAVRVTPHRHSGCPQREVERKPAVVLADEAVGKGPPYSSAVHAADEHAVGIGTHSSKG